ncbi:glycoside hydrolase family 2 protein [Mucilaginibacter sp. Mucisp84]|uniref:glycoside hydrolase family 2 protein n=1 Tax=Mucilaginibacter sp. Mucisp84 TaxID=3243058 RepID=UPI0039A49E88
MKKILVMSVIALLSTRAFAQERQENFNLLLKDDWQMQSTVTVPAAATEISKEKFDTQGWYKVSVPSTILAGLLVNHVYNFDPFMGRNLEKLADPKLDKPWWFRKEFTLPVAENGKNVILRLHGINYKANVWFNGLKIADSTKVKGPYRIIDLDLTKNINYSGTNTLAIEVLRPFTPNKRDGDLAIDYADWIPYPQDYNGGIINNVEVRTYNKVGVKFPLVTTDFDLPSLAVAHLTVDAQVTNYTNKPQDAVIKGRINENISFEKKVHLLANESKNVNFSPSEFKQLNIKDPSIWWPWQYGKPNLNRIEVSAVVNRKLSNSVSENFGIRQFTSRIIDNNQSREFIVNGKPIMLRGAAWSPDIFQRRSPERQEQEIRLVRDMNMNIVRSEGKMEDDNFYDLCDKYGLMVMNGWMCCGTWQHPEKWDAAERKVAMASDSSVMYWLRNKASLFVWLNGSDMPPTDTSVERDYLKIEKQLKWPNPLLATANESKSKVSGYSGVKMAGPYEWVPPIYWETDAAKKYGGTYSFATEISPGPSIPPYESLVKFIPKDSLNVTSAAWNYHCGTGSFGTTKVFAKALYGRYGETASIKNYVAKAQAQNYEAHRAMMEAYGLNKYQTATGVVQWMLSNPWPGIIWHTYDYYLYPAGTYFGMKKAMEPLHVLYSYKTNEVAIINSYLKTVTGLRVKADVYNLDGANKFSKTTTADIGADASKRLFALPAITGLTDTYLLRLELSDKNGETKSINWYWLSKKSDELNWKKSNWFTTPQSAYADYSALQSLSKTKLIVTQAGKFEGDSTSHMVTIKNTGSAVAFFVHLRALKGQGGDDILPVIFSDNYISLAPGESRVIKCTYSTKNADGTAPYFLTSAWNLDIAASSGDCGFEDGLPKE